jgi:hypothetical protein
MNKVQGAPPLQRCSSFLLSLFFLKSFRRSEKTGRGQVQYWVLFRVTPGATVDRTEPAVEFRASRWCRFDELKDGAAPFRQAVYAALQERFAQHLA